MCVFQPEEPAKPEPTPEADEKEEERKKKEVRFSDADRMWQLTGSVWFVTTWRDALLCNACVHCVTRATMSCYA